MEKEGRGEILILVTIHVKFIKIVKREAY